MKWAALRFSRGWRRRLINLKGFTEGWAKLVFRFETPQYRMTDSGVYSRRICLARRETASADHRPAMKQG